MPKHVDHEQRRHEIATATWRAVDELGVDGTTMRAIAERAGCTTGRLNHYFDSREAILLAALRHAHLQAAERMAAVVAGRTARDGLRSVLLEALPLDDERRTEWKVWITFWAQAITVDSFRQEHQERYREWREFVKALVIATDPKRGRVETGRITDTLLAVVDGIGVQASVAADPSANRRQRRVMDAALDLLIPKS